MNYIIALIGAGVVGVCIALEPTVNYGLGRIITPKLATLHSFLVGTFIVLLINIFSGGLSEYRNIVKAPPYLWVGGLLGAIVVYGGAKVTGVLGVASTITIMVAVQLGTSILIDNFGLFGAERVPIDISRIIGILLLIVAVKLIVK